jgi:hypothetical protein
MSKPPKRECDFEINYQDHATIYEVWFDEGVMTNDLGQFYYIREMIVENDEEVIEWSFHKNFPDDATYTLFDNEDIGNCPFKKAFDEFAVERIILGDVKDHFIEDFNALCRKYGVNFICGNYDGSVHARTDGFRIDFTFGKNGVAIHERDEYV